MEVSKKIGFTLVESVVALGVMSIGAIAGMSLMESQSKNQHTIQTRGQVSILNESVASLLQSGRRCAQSLRSKNPNDEHDGLRPFFYDLRTPMKEVVDLDPAMLDRIVVDGTSGARESQHALVVSGANIGNKQASFAVERVSGIETMGSGTCGFFAQLHMNFRDPEGKTYSAQRSVLLRVVTKACEGVQEVVTCQSHAAPSEEICVELGGLYDESATPPCMFNRVGIAASPTARAKALERLGSPEGLAVDGRSLVKQNVIADGALGTFNVEADLPNSSWPGQRSRRRP